MTVIETQVDPTGWAEALSEVDGPQLVVGGPGSGKTEFLVRRAHHLVTEHGVPPDRVLLLSFSRRGAADLRHRLTARLDRSFAGVAAVTFHSLALRVIEAHGASGDWPTIPTPLTGPEHVALVADLLRAEDAAAWPLPYRGLLATRSFAAEVADFCLRASERLVGPAELREMGRSDWRALPDFTARYRAALTERGRIDYGSLQVEALRLLADPEVRTSVAEAARYVLVDEYQDTTVAQAALLEALLGEAGNITAAGDPYQSVYSFRGTELANVAGFADQFPGTPDRPCRRLILTTSFRVPARILEAAVGVTAGAGLPGAAGPVRPAPGEGAVETHRFDQQSHEAEWIASEIQRINLRDRIRFGRIAVLVRSKRGLLTELSRALHRRRIPHDRPGDRLNEHPVIKPVLDLVTAATAGGEERTAALRRIILGSLVGLPLSAARELERRRQRGESWPDILASGDPALARLGALLDDPTWAAAAPAPEGFWQIWTTVDGFSRIVARPELAEERAALASFGQALERLAERDPKATLVDYLELSSAEDFEAEPLLEFRAPGDDQVTLTTMHQAKGLDFDVVFIADAREGVLPDLRRRDSILGARHLSPHHGGDDAAYARFRLQEEMRLVYTAVCRARLRVVVTCTSVGGVSGGAPSRIFTLLTRVPMEEAAQAPRDDADPVTPPEAEAWLRRILRDPARPHAQRLAALAAVTEGAAWQPRPAAEFSGVLARGPDTGVIGSPAVLSPSQAESYRSCPRRYVFERALRIGTQGSHYASLGGLIHEVLEEVERRAAESGRDHATAEEAAAALDARFDPSEFGGEPWAEAWRRRTQEILGRLYDHWPGEGPAVGLEEDVERVLDGVRWRGRVDRLERRDDGVWVVDYKTGTRSPTVPEAAASLQLGFYVSACDGHDVAGAELWYPAARGARVRIRRFDMGMLDEVETGLLEVQAGILGEAWHPKPGPQCERCRHRVLCPAWPEGAEAFSS